jgi:probable phosphoglycerate mutase
MRETLKLYLVRHGETAWSLSGQHTGRTDIPLTAHGEDEALSLAAYLSRISFAHVLSSPRQRARRTCELLRLEKTSEINQDLAEWDYGAYEGQRTVDIHKDRPNWDLWKDGCPGGEMPADVSARADRLIAYLFTLQGNVALFSHGHFGCALAARWIGLAVDEGRHLVIDPASLGILGFAPRHDEVRAVLLWNASAQDLSMQ